jgi:hypothetical protein
MEALPHARRRREAHFATGMSTIKYHMLPLCGTNPAWRQGLAGRPAIAGCAPMLPRCGTNPAWRQSCRQNLYRSAFSSVGTFHPLASPSENPHEPVNPCNCTTCTISPYFPHEIFFLTILQLFALRPRSPSLLALAPLAGRIPLRAGEDRSTLDQSYALCPVLAAPRRAPNRLKIIHHPSKNNNF